MQKDSILTALFRGVFIIQLLEIIDIYWWRRRELNPRPKTINPGFYMLILNFIIGREVSFRMDTTRYILKNLTFESQEISKAVLQSRRPALKSARRISGGRKLLSSYSVVIIVCDYV